MEKNTENIKYKKIIEPGHEGNIWKIKVPENNTEKKEIIKKLRIFYRT